MFRNYWLVADMDGTLTSTPSKAGGQYRPLTQSPCLTPLESLIREGMNVCVVSTAGRRMWRQVFECLKPTLAVPGAGTLAICGFSGAALFFSQTQNNSNTTMVEDSAFRNVNQTVFPADSIPSLEVMLRQRFLHVVDTIRKDPLYIPTLSKKYHAPFRGLVKALEEASSFEAAVESHLSMAQLKTYGLYLTETNDALIDMQTVMTTDVEHEKPELPLVVQYTVLGVPMKYFETIFPIAFREELAAHGFVCKAQPNSVVVCRQGIDKATCVRWLRDMYKDTFQLHRALAFGDIPATIDKPLTQFPPMKFVSVSADPSTDPPDALSMGGEEDGTACFLTALLRVCREQHEKTAEVHITLGDDGASSLFTEEVLGRVLQEAKSAMSNNKL